MTDAEYLKLRTILKRIETKVDLLIYTKQRTNAVGQTRETDGSMSELAFTDELFTSPDLHRSDSIFRDEEEILGPKKPRRYHPSGTKKT